MVGLEASSVKPSLTREPYAKAAHGSNLPHVGCHGRLQVLPARSARLAIVVLLLLIAVLASGLAWRTRQRSARRQRAMTQVLDAADALEERLRTARVEIESIVGSVENTVRDAMQEMLRQRLWLQQHGIDASLDQLIAVRDSIDAARQRIDQQLLEIERARTLL
jgi:hypothetical protein